MKRSYKTTEDPLTSAILCIPYQSAAQYVLNIKSNYETLCSYFNTKEGSIPMLQVDSLNKKYIKLFQWNSKKSNTHKWRLFSDLDKWQVRWKGTFREFAH